MSDFSMLGGSILGLASNFSWLDGGIVGVYLLVVMTAGILVRKLVVRVDEFLVAGRELDIYLGIASLAATEFGIVTCMYTAQNGYDNGFAGSIIGVLECLAMVVVGLTGFCIKPLRDAGVLTIPELFDKVYGQRVRWLSGVVIVLGGLLNMGVFLRTGGEFLVMCCGLQPKHLEITMTLLLACALVYTILGGLLSVLVTDFLQFIVMSLGLIVVTILIFFKVGWGEMVTKVQGHFGAGGFNPFVNPNMGWSYIIYNAMALLACVITWQTMIQRALATKNSKVTRQIYTRTSFFFACRFLLPGLWGVAAFTMLPADWKTQLLSALPPSWAAELAVNPDKMTLYAMPVFLSIFAPIGVMGLLVAAMIAADMSVDAGYMLCWGGIIYNDILKPFLKNPSDKSGIFINRILVGLIAAFLLLYGLWYPLKGNLWNYMIVTGTIYMSSMSVLLIACCYWKKANSWGAGAAIVVGAVLPIAYLIGEQLKVTEHVVRDIIGVNRWGIATFGLATAAMIIGSLVKPGGGINVIAVAAAEAAAKAKAAKTGA